MSDFTFRREERLKSRKIISSLFQKGSNSSTFNVYPIRFVWITTTEQDSSIQAAFSVSKKTFKRANQRNTVKRRMREAFRLHKALMYNALEGSEKQFSFMFIFNGKEEMSYQEIERAFQMGMKRWVKMLETV